MAVLLHERAGGGYVTAFHSPRTEGGVLGVVAFGQDGTLDPSFGTEGLLEMPVAETLYPPGSFRGRTALSFWSVLSHPNSSRSSPSGKSTPLAGR